MRKVFVLIPLVCMVLMLSGVSSPALAEGSSSPAEVATLFLKKFEQKDIDAVVALFAPGALVQRARLAANGPDIANFAADEWARSSKEGIAGIEDFKIEVLETSEVSFGEGTTVSVRFRATGRVGQTYFINNGVDTFSLSQQEGAWRILLYNSMEKLEFGG